MRPRTSAWSEFHELGHDGVHTHKRVRCKHCAHEIIAQAFKMEHHLRSCKMYDGEEFRQPAVPPPTRQPRQHAQLNGASIALGVAAAAAAAPVPTMNPGCSVCGQLMPVKKCGRCKETQYCSVGCQMRDWKTHKEFCGMPALIDG
ncbi:MAG: hypothetical protein Q9210_002184 [Variospora velana]